MDELIIGMDLQMEYIQMCLYDNMKKDAFSYGGEENVAVIPNDLFFCTEDNSWHSGEEASELYMTKPGKLFTDVLKKLNEEAVIILGGHEYNYIDLFCILMRMHLENCYGYQQGSLKKLVISSPMAGSLLLKAVKTLTKYLKLQKDQIELVGPEVAMLFSVFQMETNVWGNSVGLFHYNEDGMIFERVAVKRYQRPMQITITKERISSIIPEGEDGVYMPEIYSDAKDKDAAFCKLIRKLFLGKHNNVSGVFLMGSGFKDNWLANSADLLCPGRRVFVGQNLYAKGACYAAASGSAAISKDGSVYVETPSMIHYDIGVKAIYQEREVIAPIVLGNREWFNMEGSACVFLDETNQIEIAMYHNGTNEMIKEVIEIKGLPARPPKTTKLQISVRYLDEKRGEICIRDKGFGTMYPTTGKVYRKEFQLP